MNMDILEAVFNLVLAFQCNTSFSRQKVNSQIAPSLQTNYIPENLRCFGIIISATAAPPLCQRNSTKNWQYLNILLLNKR